MREIKFRAWDIDNNKMVYPSDSPDFNNEELYAHPVNIVDICLSHLSYIKLRWMQYTGLKDSKGKEIYEGDIVKYEVNFIKGVSAVSCQPGHFQLDDYPFEDSNAMVNKEFFDLQAEVIGNIYENPELLISTENNAIQEGTVG